MGTASCACRCEAVPAPQDPPHAARPAAIEWKASASNAVPCDSAVAAEEVEEFVTSGSVQDPRLDLDGDVNSRLLESLKRVDPRSPFRVVSFPDLKAYGRLPRSDSGLARPHDDLEGDVPVVFLSHRWLRPWTTKEECEENGCVWAGEPHPDDEQKTKYHVTVRGIEMLAERKGWNTSKVAVWMDYACIDQTDEGLRAAGVASVVGYLFRCSVVMVPTRSKPDFRTVHRMPNGYGGRAWTRLEALGCYIQGILCTGTPELYFIAPGEDVHRLDYVLLPHTMPSSGVLQEERDRVVIDQHQTTLLNHLHESAVGGEESARGPALVAAAGLGRMSKVKELLAALQACGPNVGVNMQDNSGITPLWSAARQGQLNLTLYLLGEKADPNITARSGLGPLHAAAQQGHAKVVAALVAHKADVNLPDKQGSSPLLWAIQNWHQDIVPLLVENCNLATLGVARRIVDRLPSIEGAGIFEVEWARRVAKVILAAMESKESDGPLERQPTEESELTVQEATQAEDLAVKRAMRQYHTIRRSSTASSFNSFPSRWDDDARSERTSRTERTDKTGRSVASASSSWSAVSRGCNA